jgi:hypothetical protein
MSDKPKSIAPGDIFPVGFGDGRSVDVVSLSLGSQRRLTALMREMLEGEESGDQIRVLDSYDKSDAMVRMVLADPSDEFMETIDAQMAYEISTACLAKQRLDDSERKKSE